MPSSTSSTTHAQSWIVNTIRQLKLIVPGAMITYYLGTLDKLVGVLQSEEDTFHRCGRYFDVLSSCLHWLDCYYFFSLFFSLSSCIYLKSHPPIQQIGVYGSRPCFRNGSSGSLCSVPDTSERWTSWRYVDFLLHLIRSNVSKVPFSK